MIQCCSTWSNAVTKLMIQCCNSIMCRYSVYLFCCHCWVSLFCRLKTISQNILCHDIAYYNTISLYIEYDIVNCSLLCAWHEFCFHVSTDTPASGAAEKPSSMMCSPSGKVTAAGTFVNNYMWCFNTQCAYNCIFDFLSLSCVLSFHRQEAQHGTADNAEER